MAPSFPGLPNISEWTRMCVAMVHKPKHSRLWNNWSTQPLCFLCLCVTSIFCVKRDVYISIWTGNVMFNLYDIKLNLICGTNIV